MAKKRCDNPEKRNPEKEKYICKKCDLKAEKEKHLCKPKKKEK
jgi:hypothetical protein